MAARPSIDLGKVRGARGREMLIRFALGAAVSVLAGIISKAAGARLGGVFLAFPAILPASLTFVQQREGTRSTDRCAVGAVLGGVGLLAFAAVGESRFARMNSASVLLLALAAWMVAIGLLYAGLVLFRPDKAQD